MADTRIVGVGIAGTLVAGVFTPTTPIRKDSDDTYLINLTLNQAELIDNSVARTGYTDVVTSITVNSGVNPTGWLTSHRFAVALSSASKDLIYATLGAANSAAAATGDKIYVTHKTVLGSITYNESITITKSIKFRGYSKTEKAIIQEPSGSVTFFVNSACEIEDFIINSGQNSLLVNAGSGNVTVRRCIMVRGTNVLMRIDSGNGTIRVENCIFKNGAFGLMTLGSFSGTMISNNNMSMRHKESGFEVRANTYIIKNCVAFDNNGADYIEVGGTFDNASLKNVSSDGTAPGTAVVDNAYDPSGEPFARYLSPSTATEFPDDDRYIDGEGGILENVGDAGAAPVDDINGRTRVGVDNVGPTQEFSGFSAAGTIPAAPTISFVSTSTGEITTNIVGDAGVTERVLYSTGGAFTVGVARSGDGNVSQPSLDDGTAYELIAQSEGTGGELSRPSNSIFVLTNAGTATNWLPLALQTIRDLLLNSLNLLAWIQETDATETTSGHVVLGRAPQTSKDVRTKGPIAHIALGNRDSVTTGNESAGQYTINADIIVEFIWPIDVDASNDYTAELDHIENIITEIHALQDTLVTGGGGEALSIRADHAISTESQDVEERSTVIRISAVNFVEA